MPRQNRDEYNEYMRTYMLERYYTRRREAITFLGGQCRVCGGTDGLELDHIDPKTKAFELSKKLHTVSKAVFWSEVRKCQLLCEAHHATKSIADAAKQPAAHGTMTMYTHYGCRCALCKASRRTSWQQYSARAKQLRRERQIRQRGATGSAGDF